jgi:hypothetical protein
LKVGSSQRNGPANEELKPGRLRRGETRVPLLLPNQRRESPMRHTSNSIRLKPECCGNAQAPEMVGARQTRFLANFTDERWPFDNLAIYCPR